MANRRQLVKRRKAVRNIRKITRTMQLIATARFQQAMLRAVATRPYAQKLAEMVTAARSSATTVEHPLLRVNAAGRTALVVITSNRGLCGSYNANVLRTAHAEIHRRREAGETIDLHAIGKKGVGYLRFLGVQPVSARVDIDDRPRFLQISEMADGLMAAYARGDIMSVQVTYMRFFSSGMQRPTVMQLLPITADAEAGRVAPAASAAENHAADAKPGALQLDFSPAPAELLAELLPATVRMRLFQCFTDAAASEQVARMVAMKAATDSAGDMIKLLTRQYNRARQTAITLELLDIVGGAAAIS